MRRYELRNRIYLQKIKQKKRDRQLTYQHKEYIDNKPEDPNSGSKSNNDMVFFDPYE